MLKAQCFVCFVCTRCCTMQLHWWLSNDYCFFMYSRVRKVIFESNYCQKWQHLDNSSSNMDPKSCQKWQKMLKKSWQFWQLNIARAALPKLWRLTAQRYGNGVCCARMRIRRYMSLCAHCLQQGCSSIVSPQYVRGPVPRRSQSLLFTHQEHGKTCQHCLETDHLSSKCALVPVKVAETEWCPDEQE